MNTKQHGTIHFKLQDSGEVQLVFRKNKSIVDDYLLDTIKRGIIMKKGKCDHYKSKSGYEFLMIPGDMSLVSKTVGKTKIHGQGSILFKVYYHPGNSNRTMSMNVMADSKEHAVEQVKKLRPDVAHRHVFAHQEVL